MQHFNPTRSVHSTKRLLLTILLLWHSVSQWTYCMSTKKWDIPTPKNLTVCHFDPLLSSIPKPVIFCPCFLSNVAVIFRPNVIKHQFFRKIATLICKGPCMSAMVKYIYANALTAFHIVVSWTTSMCIKSLITCHHFACQCRTSWTSQLYPKRLVTMRPHLAWQPC